MYSSSPQTTPVGTEFAEPVVALVTDSGGNPIKRADCPVRHTVRRRIRNVHSQQQQSTERHHRRSRRRPPPASGRTTLRAVTACRRPAPGWANAPRSRPRTSPWPTPCGSRCCRSSPDSRSRHHLCRAQHNDDNTGVGHLEQHANLHHNIVGTRHRGGRNADAADPHRSRLWRHPDTDTVDHTGHKSPAPTEVTTTPPSTTDTVTADTHRPHRYRPKRRAHQAHLTPPARRRQLPRRTRRSQRRRPHPPGSHLPRRGRTGEPADSRRFGRASRPRRPDPDCQSCSVPPGKGTPSRPFQFRRSHFDT